MTVAHWACFEADPTSEPPFSIRVGITEDGKVGGMLLKNCKSIPGGAKKVMAMLAKEGMSRTKRFYFIYPQYDVSGSDENAMNEIAGLVLTESEKLGFGFERSILALNETDLVDTVPC